jgi:hypothetical protein
VGIRLGEKIQVFFIFFIFLGILRDERIIVVSSRFRKVEIDNNKIIKYYFVVCYTHNIHGWSTFFALLHVTT